MTNVESFGSYEEMLARMKEREEIADAGILPSQRGIPWGGYVFRMGEMGDEVIPIWGRIQTREEYKRSEWDPEEETEGSFDDRAEEFFNSHYRYGEWFSPICPEGEWGSAHLVTLWPIEEKDFEDAQAHGWGVEATFLERVRDVSRAEALAEGQITDV